MTMDKHQLALAAEFVRQHWPTARPRAGLVVAAVGLTGCGRKGALEAPPGMAIKAANAGDVPPDEKSAKPDKPFPLNPLIK